MKAFLLRLGAFGLLLSTPALASDMGALGLVIIGFSAVVGTICGLLASLLSMALMAAKLESPKFTLLVSSLFGGFAGAVAFRMARESDDFQVMLSATAVAFILVAILLTACATRAAKVIEAAPKSEVVLSTSDSDPG